MILQVIFVLIMLFHQVILVREANTNRLGVVPCMRGYIIAYKSDCYEVTLSFDRKVLDCKFVQDNFGINL